MYDYYEMVRQQTITNTKLEAINNNINTLNNNQTILNNSINNMGVLITMIISLIAIYKFIERCLR